MNRTLLRVSTLVLPFAWAACSDSPLQPTVERDPVTAEARFASVSSAAALQAALDDAATDGRRSTIYVRGAIELKEPLTYVGDHDLTLVGSRGARIVGPTNPIAPPSSSAARVGEETVGDALQVLGEPDLTVRNIDFEGQSGHGIYFELTDDASGTVRVNLNRTTFAGQGLSAVWVEDQKGGSEAAPDPIESNASIYVSLTRVNVFDTGKANGASSICSQLDEDLGCEWADFDGMRFNEGGRGGITFFFRDVDFRGNFGDGIEFDEIGDGSVVGTVVNSSFNENGAQLQFPVDVEDGFDIDEAGDGGLKLAMINTEVNDNIDEGVDLDENGSGDAAFAAFYLEATGNVDENIKITESEDDPVGAGDIVLSLFNVTADGSLDSRGARFEEFGEGGVRGVINGSSFSENTEDDGLRVDEEGDGSIALILRRVSTNGNDGQGIQMTEDGTGDIGLSLTRSESTGNGNTAVELEEEDAGGHDVTVRNSTITGAGGEKSLDVIEDGDGSSTVTIRNSTIDPAPDSSGDVVFN